MDGVVYACLVWVFEFLDLELIRHKCVGHHAVDQEHERWGSTVYKGTQTPHQHHYDVFTGGKPKLC